MTGYTYMYANVKTSFKETGRESDTRNSVCLTLILELGTQ